jgi:hypothetical protein
MLSEDVGGVWGYSQILEDLARPPRQREHPFFERGGKWDSEKFSLDKVNKALRRLR